MDVKSLMADCRSRFSQLVLESPELRCFRFPTGDMLDASEVDKIQGKSYCIRDVLSALISAKQQTVVLLDRTHEHAGGISAQLDSLAEKSAQVRRLHGRWELAVGYPMIEGCFSDGTIVRTPVYLFAVQLEKTSERWSISKLNDGPPAVNPVLVEAAVAAAGASQLPEDSVKLTSAWSVMQHAQDTVRLLGIQAELPEITGEELQMLDAYDPAEPPAYAYDEFRLQSSMVIGRFSRETAAFHRAFSECMETGGCKAAAEAFLSEEPREQLRLENQPIDENRSCAAAPLDVRQLQAVQAASVSRKVAVTGAPGTGKTQVMVSCIAGHLAHGRKVLMVSPRRTDRDEAYNRLAQLGISAYAVNISDERADRDAVLDCIDASITDHEASPDADAAELESSRLKQAFLELSHDIEKKTARLEGIYHALNRAVPSGKTLYELYTETSSDSRMLIQDLAENCEVYGQFDEQQIRQLEQLYQHMLPRLHYNVPEHPASFRMSFHQAREEDREAWVNSAEAALTGLRRIAEAKPFSDQWARQHLFSGNDPAVRCRELGGMISQIQLELKQAQLLGAEELGDIQEGKELLQTLQRTHAWQPAFWRSLKAMKRRKPKGEPLFAYSRKLRYSLHIADRLQQLQQTFEKHMPYDDLLFVESQLEVFQQSVAQYEHIWNCLQELKGCLQEKKLTELFVQAAAGDVNESITFLEEFQQLAAEQFGDIAELDQAAANAPEPLRQAVEALVRHCSYDQEQLEHQGHDILINTLRYCQLQYGEQQAEDQLSSLNQVEELTAQIRADIAQKQELVPRLVQRRVDQKIYNLLDKSWQAFEQREAIRNRRQELRLETFIRQFLDQGLLELIPCWIVSPEIAAMLFPPKQFFDLLLVDGAALLENDQALPLLQMAESVLYAGDPMVIGKQLQGRSLHEAAEHACDPVALPAHYRSEDERLFAFANAACFENKLLTPPNSSPAESPISLIIPKATSVGASAAEALTSCLDAGCESAAVAVCAAHQKQQVRNAVQDVLGEDPRMRRLMDACEDYLFTVDELQGEARDCVIFLPDLAEIADEGGGVLGAVLGCVRKHLTVIVPEDAELEESTDALGIQRWHDFLRFAQQLGSDESAGKRLLSVESGEAGALTEQVYEALVNKGLQVEKQVGYSSCTVDAAVFDPQQQRYVLGILCDSPDSLGSCPRETEIWKREFLESRGWRVHRVWSRNWWMNASRETATILSKVKQ